MMAVRYLACIEKFMIVDFEDEESLYSILLLFPMQGSSLSLPFGFPLLSRKAGSAGIKMPGAEVNKRADV
jgi:hypothetical protein